MNKQGSLIAAAALAAMLGLGGCSAAATASTTPGAPAPAAASSTPVAPMPAMTGSGDAMAGMIHIDSGAYRDATPVGAGTMVMVMNMDTSSYTMTSDDGTSFSVKVPAGASVSFMAPDKPGNYPFHSDGNNGMHGVLTVR